MVDLKRAKLMYMYLLKYREKLSSFFIRSVMENVFDVTCEKTQRDYFNRFVKFFELKYEPTQENFKKLDRFMEKIYANVSVVKAFIEQTAKSNTKYSIEDLYDYLGLYCDMSRADIRKSIYILALEGYILIRNPYVYFPKVNSSAAEADFGVNSNP